MYDSKNDGSNAAFTDSYAFICYERCTLVHPVLGICRGPMYCLLPLQQSYAENIYTSAYHQKFYPVVNSAQPAAVMMHFVKQTNQAMHGRVQYSRRTS
jgi:hypothetical protein